MTYEELAVLFSRWHKAKHGATSHIGERFTIAFVWTRDEATSWLRLWYAADEQQRTFMLESVPTYKEASDAARQARKTRTVAG